MLRRLFSKIDNSVKTHQQNKPTKLIVSIISIIVILLAILIAAIPGALAIMRRADAQVALGNAKSLRLALQVASTEAYAAGRPFRDASQNGGVTEEVWQNAVTDSRVPGDFWVLQTDRTGYEVLRFIYQEGISPYPTAKNRFPMRSVIRKRLYRHKIKDL